MLTTLLFAVLKAALTEAVRVELSVAQVMAARRIRPSLGGYRLAAPLYLFPAMPCARSERDVYSLRAQPSRR
jgi:hypothetical protein